MLRFDLRLLDGNPVVVDDVLASDDDVWTADDRRPLDGVQVTGRLSNAGSGRYYFSGTLAGQISGDCRRCLEPVEVGVSEEAHVMFVEADDAEITDDPDVYTLDERQHDLDLRPAIREHWLLAAPAFVQCRDDCQGLCLTCGADLNAGPCSCAAVVDPRWDALRAAQQNAPSGEQS